MSPPEDAHSPELITQLRSRLDFIYPGQADALLPRLLQLLEKYRSLIAPSAAGWDERDMVLITYGDQVQDGDRPTLSVLDDFLQSTGLDSLINTVHLLPFYPYSSDDGFSVIDYCKIDPALGDWQHVRELGAGQRLMFDLVLNHISQHSDWFQSYLQGKPPYGDFGERPDGAGIPNKSEFFLSVDPDLDLSKVTRPRSLPLLTAFETAAGTRHVWTTFSPDQVDLNYGSPDVLLAMLDVLLFYAQQGARIVRLDAIAFLWKEIGTSCVHLPQTHEVVKLAKDVLQAVAPHVLLLTETNVPHRENVSYFGSGDEADMVYQFSLPPLLLDALLSEDATALNTWMAGLDAIPSGCSFFNFTASHDGIGVRPLEGIVPDERIDHLAEAVRARGGKVSTRRRSDGRDTPYELNITYFSALGDPGGTLTDELHVRRFLTSQAIMLAQRGIPGIYFHSLLGSPNDTDGMVTSGQPRRINRRKFQLAELDELLAETDSPQKQVYEGYRKLLATRLAQPAFHPEAEQAMVPGSDALVLFTRSCPAQQLLIAANVTSAPQSIPPSALAKAASITDVLTGEQLATEEEVQLGAFQTRWLELKG